MIRQYFSCKNYDEAESARCALACSLPSPVSINILDTSVLTSTWQQLYQPRKGDYRAELLIICLFIPSLLAAVFTGSDQVTLVSLAICVILVALFIYISYEKRRALLNMPFSRSGQFVMVIEYMPDMRSTIAQTLIFFPEITPI